MNVPATFIDALAGEAKIISGEDGLTKDRHQDARILIVDEPLTVNIIQGHLTAAGYNESNAVSDPELVVSTIIELRPDIILLDLEVPTISGFEVLRAIRDTDDLRLLPVVALVASSEPTNKRRALEIGATDFLNKPVDPSELEVRLVNTLSAQAYQSRSAFTDLATGMPNARVFEHDVQEAIAAADATNTKLAVIQIGIDRLKQIHDSLGPRAGDLLVQQVGQRLQATEPNDLTITHYGTQGEVSAIARISNNEFALLITALRNLGDTASFARRYCNRLSGTYVVDGQELFVNARAGIAGYPDDGASSEVITENASAALSQVKTGQSETCTFYSEDATLQAMARLNQEIQLRKAIENKELELYFQPKVDVASGKIRGSEVLLRWDNAELGRVPPSDFIPIAEDAGLIVPIGSWVFRNSAQLMAAWRKQGFEPLPISVNVSPLQFAHVNFVREITDVIAEFDLPPELFTLEITETVFLEGGRDATEIMKHLQTLGFKLSIDDFGTGYSSLSYLKQYPVDELKIDRSFIGNIGDNDDDVAIVAAIINLARGLRLQVVSEGVETDQQLELLRASQCDQYQGYLFSKPIKAHEYFDLLNKQQ